MRKCGALAEGNLPCASDLKAASDKLRALAEGNLPCAGDLKAASDKLRVLRYDNVVRLRDNPTSEASCNHFK